jgi:hypothetical protein
MIPRYPEASAGLKQAFPLTITATFVYTNADDLQGYVPPPPPVLFRVPYDVFYPFQSNAAAGSNFHSQSISFLAVAVVSCAIALIIL